MLKDILTNFTKNVRYIDVPKLMETYKYPPGTVPVFIGADCVGKDYIIDKFVNELGYKAFRPDYKNWTNNNPKDRYQYFHYFLRVADFLEMSQIGFHKYCIDRCSLCGAVYENNPKIAEEYKHLSRRLPFQHILVTTDIDSYEKFNKSRGVTELTVKEQSDIDIRYVKYLLEYEIPFTVVYNKYKEC